jgi:hypothetical protein
LFEVPIRSLSLIPREIEQSYLGGVRVNRTGDGAKIARQYLLTGAFRIFVARYFWHTHLILAGYPLDALGSVSPTQL